MIAGSSVEVQTGTFQNDAVNFANKDDVLTYLIHLGYLAYDTNTERAFVPNEEIRQELIRATKRKTWNEFLDFQRESSMLLDATLDMDAETVAAQIEKIHMEYASVIQYHNENSLSSVLTIAYLSAMQQIWDKRYPDSIKAYTGEILLVAVNYDRKTKTHQCLIEKYEKL